MILDSIQMELERKYEGPDYKFTSQLGVGSMEDAATEPTMQLSQPKNVAPEPVTTKPAAGAGGLVELIKNIGVAREMFSPENKARNQATEDKRTFYYAINVVNNFYADRDKPIQPQYKSVFVKSQLINYVNDGTLPYTWEEVYQLKGSTNELDRQWGEHHRLINEFVQKAGKEIFSTRTTTTQQPVKQQTTNP